MALISMHNVTWGLGGAPLLDNVDLHIEKGERVCLLGRNGAGKSTLIKLLDGRLQPDSGEIGRRQGITIASLGQEVPARIRGTLFEVVTAGLDQPEDRQNGRSLHHDDHIWTLAPRVDDLLSRAGLDPALDFADLSAGMKRRTMLCRALIRQPDLLLLDEPTNHLDIASIVWLEEYLAKYVQTLLFVSHDRSFAGRIANRIIELDRGCLVSYACDYATYLKRSAADAHSEETRNRRFDKKLSAEEDWIRQGIKARRTRNQGRVRALEKMREAYRARRLKTGNVRLRIQEAERSGNLVIEAKGINYTYDGVRYIQDLSTLIMRGDKIGLIGPNGCGKTTLLKILLQEILPDSGSVRHGTQLQVAYFDQLRAQLDPDRTVAQNIAEGNDFIIFQGQKRHVISYLQDFLFPPQRCRTPVHILSGGEKNRLLLAKLFVRPANVLVLDEPTNDLDTETLELLEDLLMVYAGTLLLVSHDRTFVNNVVTSTLVFEGNGRIQEYPGGYDDWLAQRPAVEEESKTESAAGKQRQSKPKTNQPRKLGYMEQRELETLPDKISLLEAEQKELFTTLSDPQLYKNAPEKAAVLKSRLQTVEAAIAEAYQRWEALEAVNQNSTSP